MSEHSSPVGWSGVVYIFERVFSEKKLCKIISAPVFFIFFVVFMSPGPASCWLWSQTTFVNLRFIL